MKSEKNDQYWFIVKVIAMIIALVGVFWAKTALQENAQKTEPEQAPIPAKVQFGK